MTIYTRRGDTGTTSLANGDRVGKDSARVEAYGTIDEANSAVGLARTVVQDDTLDQVLHFVQQRLFNCSSSVATPAASASEHTPTISAEDVELLERAVDRFEESTGPLEHFVIEAGSEAAARLHAARATCRRAERRVAALAAQEPVAEQVLAFINRLSDCLFAAARYANSIAGSNDELWDATAPRPEL